VLNSSADFGSVALRFATPEDEAFLRAVFGSTRSDELASLAWDPKQVQAFIDTQFNIQQQSYRACHPAAKNQTILLAAQPIGRMLVDRTTEAVTLVDIAILDDFRKRGIGSFLIRQLLDEAAALQKSVSLSVYKFNAALRLYKRLGFSKVREAGLYIQMEWSPRSDPQGHQVLFERSE